jgi:hypothetical protein
MEIFLYSGKYRKSQFLGIYIIIIKVLLNFGLNELCNETRLTSTIYNGTFSHAQGNNEKQSLKEFAKNACY